ncbi:MAG: tRNA1(Val) (adenine(37)-N6)-methyltransferase, partial [Syntrophales bacterium]
DAILGGSLKIIQKKRGYRFSIDAFLLADFISLKKGDRILDLGTGSGIVGMLLCRHDDCSEVVGIEIQEALADAAQRSIRLNRLEDRMRIIHDDLRRIRKIIPASSFNVVIANPPYRKIRSGRINPDRQKAVARHEITGTLHDFMKAASYALNNNGRIYAIYPATRLAELLQTMRKHGMEPKQLRIVHSYKDTEGEFVLIAGVKGAKEAMEIMPPLIIYNDDGHYSAAATRLFSDPKGLINDVDG